MKTILFIAVGICSLLCHAQQGFRFQYAVSDKGAAKASYNLDILSKSGNTRSEIRDANTGQLINTYLKLKRKPDVSYNVLAGTYIQIPHQQLKEYQVSVLGTETVNGYPCTKVSVVTYKEGNSQTVWLSKDIPGYENYLGAYICDMDLVKLNKALKEQGQGGIPVRTESQGESIQVVELVSVKAADVSDSVFEVKENQKGRTSDELKKSNEITEEQYQLMKVEEERAKQEYENKQKKKSD